MTLGNPVSERRVEHLRLISRSRRGTAVLCAPLTAMLLGLVLSSSLGAPTGGTPPTFAADFYVGRQDNVAIHHGSAIGSPPAKCTPSHACSTPSNAPERKGGGMGGRRARGGESVAHKRSKEGPGAARHMYDRITDILATCNHHHVDPARASNASLHRRRVL